MGVKNFLAKTAGKAASAVSKTAVLSPEELEKVQSLREEYYSQKPDPGDELSQMLTEKYLNVCGSVIFNTYLQHIGEIYAPISKDAEYAEKLEDGTWSDNPFDADYNIRYINITKWVIDKQENSLEKLVNVYDVLSNEDCNIALVFKRSRENTEVYLAVINTDNAGNRVKADNFQKRIESAIRGNFPGSEWKDEPGIGKIPCLDNGKKYSVAAATNIPTEKSEKFKSQTIEKLLDGIIPEDENQEFILILLATPVKDAAERKQALSDFYSMMTPFASWQTQFSFSDSSSVGSSGTVGINLGASAGTQKGVNSSLTNSDANTINEASTDSATTSEGASRAESKTDTFGSETSVGLNVQTINLNGGVNRSTARGITDTVIKGTAKTIAKTIGNAATKTISKTAGTFASTNFGANVGANFARSSNVTTNIGKNETIHQNFTNHSIKYALEKLDNQMKRYEKSAAMGMWDFAAYVLSEDHNTANNVAHSYLALTQGEESFMSEAAVNIWRGDRGEDSAEAAEICAYLRDLRHPIFGLRPGLIEADSEFHEYPMMVTATTSLSGKELAYSLNFPQKSVVGLPVIECASFGRNVVSYDDNHNRGEKLNLGNIYHMNHEEQTPVYLMNESLTSHTFITGSTGTGKSNTIYQILNEARKTGIKFLVVEPAKGEYKNAFGNLEDVRVYGTNPAMTPLLRLNPFSFPKNEHVLEHIDRLIEIFNVCWPMYAAMPAVLKNAVEKAYEDCGWDLSVSKNKYGNELYPEFNDVCRNVKTIIDSSEYDNENKGAYKGSLLTRLESLTNGINGMIFSSDEICGDILFGENVIVDLSRVGSMETKTMLMGILVLKLQEYRMETQTISNAPLKHITVLEEAHNLLKRTSVEQSTESSNLIGKSVEMISNAIAEMRTYGEAFIIADQAPGLLDMAAIRNTNTKIIMRLPDQGDRELVGKSANLNDDQITELAKIQRGVAAIYQNEWIQPILCKVKKADVLEEKFEYIPDGYDTEKTILDNRIDIAYILCGASGIETESELKDIKADLFDSNLPDSLKVSIMRWMENVPNEPKITKLAPIMSRLFPEIKDIIKTSYSDNASPEEWTKNAERVLRGIVKETINDRVRRDIIQSIFTDYLMFDLNNMRALQDWSEKGGLR